MTRPPLAYERRIVLTAVAAVVPAILAALLLAWLGDFDAKSRWTVFAVVAAAMFIATWVLHEQLVFPLRTLANLVAALREGDYTLRARGTHQDDALGQVLREINDLSDILEGRKLEALETGALLRTVLEEIDSAILAFDQESRVRLMNRAAEHLFATTSERALGRTADEIGVAPLLEEGGPETIDLKGRWRVRRSTFRQNGVPHRLLVLTDMTRALREEEALAWQRLVRVLGHELNNSLTPIKSIAQSVDHLVSRDPLPDDWREDVQRGTRVISGRAESLTRFLRAYAQLARLPQPRKTTLDLSDVIRRVALLETRAAVVAEGRSLLVDADPDQIEQLLINLVRNAADAGENVRVEWRPRSGSVEIRVVDDGPGLSGSANLFVPFFTTKPGGSGIGLVLSRQIAEAHGGSLTLENRKDGRGAVATVIIPSDARDLGGDGRFPPARIPRLRSE
ncbi:MAG TPA: ATP-binding protein [Thermoanaerobaculia bacterium]|nr:ATP-binding protein [Thermoanaerobaculia bacterium]